MKQLKVLLIHMNPEFLKIIEGFAAKDCKLNLICIHLTDNLTFSMGVLEKFKCVQPDVLILGDIYTSCELNPALLYKTSTQGNFKFIFVGSYTGCWEKTPLWIPIDDIRIGYDVYQIWQGLAKVIRTY